MGYAWLAEIGGKTLKGIKQASGTSADLVANINKRFGKGGRKVIDEGADGLSMFGKKLDDIKTPKDLEDLIVAEKTKGSQIVKDIDEQAKLPANKDVAVDDVQVREASAKAPDTKANLKGLKDVDGKVITKDTVPTKMPKNLQKTLTTVGTRLGFLGAGLGAVIGGLQLFAQAKSGCYLVNSKGTATTDDDAKSKISDSKDVAQCTCAYFKSQSVSIDKFCQSMTGCGTSTCTTAAPADGKSCYCGATLTTSTLRVDDMAWTDVLTDMVVACGEIITATGNLIKSTLSAGSWLVKNWWVFVVVIIVGVIIYLGVKYGTQKKSAAAGKPPFKAKATV